MIGLTSFAGQIDRRRRLAFVGNYYFISHLSLPSLHQTAQARNFAGKISPRGTRVELFSNVGGTSNDVNQVTFDDDAAQPIATATPPFSEEALRALFEHSAGMPREATILADNALLLGYYTKQTVIDRSVVDAAFADRQMGLTGVVEPAGKEAERAA